MEAAVTGNEDCSFGLCSDTNFIVSIESVEEWGSALIANKIGTEWRGSVTVRVGGLFGDLVPGKQVVSVDATGAWSLRFTLE